MYEQQEQLHSRGHAVEENLSRTFAACTVFYSKYFWKCLTLKMKIKATEYNIHILVSFDGEHQPL